MGHVQLTNRSHQHRLRGASRPGLRLGAVALLLCVGLVAAQSAQAVATVEQDFDLQPGWNAIYLEVEPVDKNIEQAFAGVPINSVWRWIPQEGPVEFIQDPADGLRPVNGWFGYFPPPSAEAALSNLFTLDANTAYLVHLDGNNPVNWRVRGVPEPRMRRWAPDSFNLTGFSVDPNLPATFGTWFTDSPAHESQLIYQLSSSGVWELVDEPFTTQIDSGRAYWVFTQGNSDFQGPLIVDLQQGTELEFSNALSQFLLVVTNASPVDVDVTVSRVPGFPTPVPLVIEQIDDENADVSWPEVPDVYTVEVESKDDLLMNLGVRRARFQSGRVEHVLEVNNGLGVRFLVSVGADSIQEFAPPAAVAKMNAEPGRTKAVVSSRYSGLWVGVIEVDMVSEAQQAGVMPVPTGRTYPLRFIVHVDGGGQARLLKEVIQMWQEGTLVPDPENPDRLVVGTPGRYVLITDDSLLMNYTGAENRDGDPVGVRVSTTAYDYDGTEMDMDGEIGPGQTLTTTLVLDPQFPTNPFKHRYHPDHDNLDAQFLNFLAEAYEVTREMQFQFDGGDASEDDPPDFGDSLLTGSFFESVTGLHKNTIFVSGTFRLQRVSAVAVLNQ